MHKVVHLLAPAPTGGLESVVAALARSQESRGDTVFVAPIVHGPPAEHPFVQRLSAAGRRVVPIVCPGRGYLLERRAVRQLVRAVEPDVLHTHGYRPDVVDAPVARRLHTPTVTTVHGFTGNGLRNRLYEWAQVRSYRRFGAVVAVSERLGRDLISQGVPKERVHVVRNAWEPDRPFLDRGEARQVLGIPDDRKVVGWVGRLSPEKAPEVALQVIAAWKDPAALLAMVGQGGMDAELNGLAEELGVSDRVAWLGRVPDAARCMRGFDALLLTSRTEGTPMVLLEAMAAGVPIVTTAVGGIPEFLSGQEAVLAPSGDAPALAAGLAQVFDRPADAKARAGGARHVLEEKFDVGSWVERYSHVYETVTGSP